MRRVGVSNARHYVLLPLCAFDIDAVNVLSAQGEELTSSRDS